jgi:WD40 repeat protein
VFLANSTPVWSIAPSPDQTKLVAGTEDGALKILAWQGGAADAPQLVVERQVAAPSGYPVASVAWGARGILACSQGPRRGVSDISGSLVKLYSEDLARHVSFGAALHDGQPCAAWLGRDEVVTAGPDGLVCVWAAEDAALLASFRAPDRVLDLCVRGQDRAAAQAFLACADLNVHVCALGGGAVLFSIPAPSGVLCMALSASGRRLALGLHKSVEVWALGGEDCAKLGEFPLKRERFVTRPALDDDYVAVGHEDGSVAVHSLQGRDPSTPVALLHGHTGPVNQVIWGDLPRRALLSASDDWAVRSWVV